MEMAVVSDLWQKRWNQDILGAQAGLSHLKSIKAPMSYHAVLELDLLEASLLRARKEYKSSSQMLAKILKRHSSLQEPPYFRLSFELGMDYWVSEDISGALEYFLAAEKLACSPMEKIFTLSNLLWCLDHLALPQKDTAKKLNRELQQTQATTKDQSPYLNHVEQQFLTYKMRKDFFNGKSLESYKGVSEKFHGQASYLFFWLQELPYVGSGKTFTEQDRQLLKDNYLWQLDYRLGTLTGQVSLEDKFVLRLDDGIARLYLWIWLWISGDSRANIEKILYVLESVLHILELDKLSKENTLLLRNSLGWLFLLNPKLVKKMAPIYQRLRKVQDVKGFPVLDDEFALIQHLSSVSFLKTQRNYRGHAYFQKMARSLEELKKDEGSCSILMEYAREFKKTVGTDYSYSVIVDLSSDEVRCLPENQVIRSAILSRFFSLIVKNEIIPIADLDLEIAGDRRRVYNLCARVKDLCPELEITIRGNQIYRESSAHTISILHKNRGDLFKTVEFIEAAPARSLPVNIQAAKFIFKQGFVRSDFQKAFNISKATACRFIGMFEHEGAIVKEGLGRNVFYKWSQL